MPELPDVDVYVDTIGQHITGKRLDDLRIGNPFLVRSLAPSPSDLAGARGAEVRRIGKRVALGFDNGMWAVIHLMVAGRFQWKAKPPALGSKTNLASFDFENGSLLLTEAGTKKRASLHIVEMESGLKEHDPGGLEPLECTFDQFRDALTRKKPHAQARPRGSAYPERHRKCIFR